MCNYAPACGNPDGEGRNLLRCTVNSRRCHCHEYAYKTKAPEAQPLREPKFKRHLRRVFNVEPYTENELPQPHVDFTFGLLNLNPEPSIVSM
jgi:hypothetical protein